MNVDDVYKIFKSWFSKNLNSSANKELAWSCFLAGFLAQVPQDPQVQINEARINELEMWRGNRLVG